MDVPVMSFSVAPAIDLSRRSGFSLNPTKAKLSVHTVGAKKWSRDGLPGRRQAERLYKLKDPTEAFQKKNPQLLVAERPAGWRYPCWQRDYENSSTAATSRT